jgi:hypothetical protein
MSADDPIALRRRLVDEMGRGPDRLTTTGLELLCRSLVSDLGFNGAVITLMASGEPEAVAAVSDPSTRVADAVQFDMGEGPSRDAFALGRPVLVPDLATNDGQWPGLESEAAALGISAVFAFPLQLGATRLGVLTCYSDRPRFLLSLELSACLTYASVATDFLIDRVGAPGLDHRSFWQDEVEIRTQVYQAQGMVMVDLGVSLAEALVRLRAAAFSEGVPLNELAAQVVAGLRSLPSGDDPAPDGARSDGPDT